MERLLWMCNYRAKVLFVHTGCVCIREKKIKIKIKKTSHAGPIEGERVPYDKTVRFLFIYLFIFYFYFSVAKILTRLCGRMHMLTCRSGTLLVMFSTYALLKLLSYIRHLSYCLYIAVNRICVAISRVDGALKPC